MIDDAGILNSRRSCGPLHNEAGSIKVKRL